MLSLVVSLTTLIVFPTRKLIYSRLVINLQSTTPSLGYWRNRNENVIATSYVNFLWAYIFKFEGRVLNGVDCRCFVARVHEEIGRVGGKTWFVAVISLKH